MEKIKLGVCMKDEEYQTRFVKCILNHYKEVYEVHVLKDGVSEETFDAIIVDTDVKDNRIPKDVAVVLVLEENGHYRQIEESSPFCYTEKYQEVYKIMAKLEKEASKRMSKKKIGRRNIDGQVMGVCSLDKANFQVPFMALLAETLGEKYRVLVMDLQPYSGFDSEISINEMGLGIEYMISLATTENYTQNRLIASIGHEQKWDYIYPAKNGLCLAELDTTTYQKLIEILQKEMGYDRIIVNFGTLFLANHLMIETCQTCYILSDKKEERSWREKSFIDELSRKGESLFLEKILWIKTPKEHPRENSWRSWMKTWLWSEFGDEVRELNWMASVDE